MWTVAYRYTLLCRLLDCCVSLHSFMQTLVLLLLSFASRRYGFPPREFSTVPTIHDAARAPLGGARAVKSPVAASAAAVNGNNSNFLQAGTGHSWPPWPDPGDAWPQGNANLQKGIRAFSEAKRTEPAATTLRRASLASNATSRADIARPDTRASQRATHMTILGSPAPHCARAHAHAKHVLRRPAQAQSSH